MINLLIDRVGNVNIFNILNSDSIGSESHIHSKMDSDLIQEYINEIENVAKVSRTLKSNLSKYSDSKLDILRDLKSLGETFFDQFFPEEIANKLRNSTDNFLHFNIDTGLKEIPWELLYDGKSFLGDKFFIGKSVKGSQSKISTEDNRKIKMLIIADPTEDLDWAQREGEELFKVLHEKISPSILELHFIAGKQISKLKLLSLIKGKHIIHYAGHLFFSKEPLENGWLLANDKVLKAREIANSGFAASLVFSNSCQSSKSIDQSNDSSIMNYFAGSFLMSGIQSFVGSNWEVADNEKTLDFTIRFYLNLFNNKSIGESLYIAREYARRNYESWDLTWANYTLHGLPNHNLLSRKKESKSKIIDPNLIRRTYPISIARSYLDFLKKEEEKNEPILLFTLLIYSFKEFSKFIGSIVFSDHRAQSMGSLDLDKDDEISLQSWWDMIFNSMRIFKKLEITMFMDSLLEILFSHRDMIFKMVGWIDILNSGKIDSDFVQGYLVTFQYYYENILNELIEFENMSILYIDSNEDQYISFDGYDPRKENGVLSLGLNSQSLDKAKGKLICYHRHKKTVLPLIGLRVIDGKGKLPEMEIITSVL